MAKKGRRATEEERIMAVQLIESGRKIDDVVEIMGVGRRTVLEWWQRYREGGLAALSTKFASGRPTTLTDRQMLELRALLLGSDPRQFSLGFALWTRALVGELIFQRFKVRLLEATIGRILKRLGMSVQRPLYRARQQDPEKVRMWKEEIFPQIRKEAAECDEVILFADEAAVRTDFHAGTTWGAIGQTPVVEGTGERQIHGQVKFLRENVSSPHVRKALFEVEAESATVMGQLVWDVSQRRDHEAPIIYLDEAIAAARQARDACTEAYATLRKGFVALYGDNEPREGVAPAAQAADVATFASPSLTGLSLLHVAEGYAMSGDAKACEEALKKAEASSIK